MDIIPFSLKESIGKMPAGPGCLFYDREFEALRFAANFRGDIAMLLVENTPIIDLPQNSISRIHFQKALLFGGGNLVIRLRNGKQNEWFDFFGTETVSIPIKKRDVEKANELITEVKFDLFEDTLDEMLESTDDTLGL